VRRGLSGLTGRGRFLLTLGIVLAALSVLLGQADLLRASVFLAALPLAATLLVSANRYRLTCVRVLDPARVPVGVSTSVRLRLENVSRVPTGVLLMEDTLPYALGRRPRFVLDRVPPDVAREAAYSVSSDIRGRYQLGPLSVRITDPFGLSQVTRSFSAVDELVVTPVVTPLPRIALGGDWASGGETSSRALASSGSDDATTREYRYGASLRKVHWRSTARVGELMVRQEENRLQSRATLLLDGRTRCHHGDGPGSSYEWAVSAVASIGVSLTHQGFGLRLLDETGRDLLPPAGQVSEGVVLEVLATAKTSRSASLSPAVAQLRRTGLDGSLVAVLGALTAEDTDELARLRQGAGRCVAVLLDTDTWSSRTSRVRAGDYERSAERLEAAGWRVLRVGHGTTLASVWPRAGLQRVSA
jgi:uncharacterized protein (DUF58 family)